MWNAQLVPKMVLTLSLDGLVTPSIEIPMKCTYSVNHYLSNKHLWMSLCLIDFELPVVFWKLLQCTPLEMVRCKKLTKKMEGAFNVRKHGKCKGWYTLANQTICRQLVNGYVPNDCVCGKDCKHVPHHLQLCIPFTTN